ncbi:YfhO family protein [Parabacteroides sp. PF5-6]|uniref:YfhO family protein n=1 Tax=Parabacteroides sp. PF5-6 TaxID=1742403 RepID=UPI0024076A8B|nr:YfhO family protein [Parabacteroides sp. PF5-6]
MQDKIKGWGKHLAAIVVFLGLVVTYFAPAIIDGKVLHQSDMIFAEGMGDSQMKAYEETAEPGEFSVWSDAAFGGMPYISGYGSPAPNLPGFDVIEKPTKSIGYLYAGMVLTGLICFYILMCVMGVNWWLALAGAIAFAFASYNILIIPAGHVTKAYVMAYMPLTLAGMALLFKRNYLWGTILFLLGVALSVSNFHMQITYYLALLCFFVYLGYGIWRIRMKAYKELGLVTAVMAVCVVLAVLPNARNLYVQWDWGKSSIRGATELTTASAGDEKISSGLDKEYAFQWSYGKGELLTMLIPNVYGGSSGGKLDSDSEYARFLRANGYQVGKEVQAPTYWGDKPFTSGPMYYGAGICFLFVLGLFVIRNPMKWWLFAGALLLTFMALGRNMAWFNDFLFHYLPMYNKFRTPETALVIPGMILPIIGLWGLKEILSDAVDPKRLKQGFFTALGITGGLCLVIWLAPTALLSFQSENYDAQFAGQPFYTGLLADRAALASSDAFRSLMFVLLTAGLVFLYLKAKNKKTVSLVVCAGIAVLTLADLWAVDKRYLNADSFVKEKPSAGVYQPSVANQEILKDTDLSYRVINLNNPFKETNTSYFHHSLGGYHAVKLRRYQELIDHRLMPELGRIIQAFQGEQVTMQTLQEVFLHTPSLNMLNTRYVIYNPGAPPVYNPFAFGNAWFVADLKVVENADAEIEALHTINPLRTAVVDKRFAGELEGFTPAPRDSVSSIELISYRPNKLTYRSNAIAEQLAVFSEIYYQPGWTATIDGQPASHFRADWTLRAMRVPAGAHEIVFEFRPKGYIVATQVGVYSSFLILLFVLAAIVYSVWEKRKK